MKYHNITKDDMLNGDGLRVVLWLAGCEHHCEGCQNPVTWDRNCGLEFDDAAKQEIFDYLDKDYCEGITFSGGDPLATYNRDEVFEFIKEIKMKYPNKTIWCYSGYTFEQLVNSESRSNLYRCIDVLVDGRYVQELRNINLPWRGSSNQRVIDIKSTFDSGHIVLLPGTYDAVEADGEYAAELQCCSCSC